MSVRLKLLILVSFVAIVPLGVSAWNGLRIHQQAVEGQVAELHEKTSVYAATLSQEHINHVGESLRLLVAQTIQWTALSADEREGALWLVYRQFDDIAVASLLDESGTGIGSSAYIDGVETAPDLMTHPFAPLPTLQAFAGHIPFKEARLGQVVIGDVFAVPGSAVPMVPIVIGVPGAREGRSWVVAIALSLRNICADVTRGQGDAVELLLVDAGSRIVCGAAFGQMLPVALQAAVKEGGTTIVRYEQPHPDGKREMLAAVTRLPMGNAAAATQSWIAVAQQPVAIAFEASRQIQAGTVFWLVMSLAVALGAGLFLSRSITQPVKQLVAGAMELAKGNFGHRLQVEDRGEFAELSRAFNHMGGEIGTRDAEIRGWNEELQERVDDRTRELREAQAQLLQTQKIAAMSSLGAGVAHEVNNPLASILGLVQLQLRAARKRQGNEKQVVALEKIEKQAQRIKVIIATLKGLTESYSGAGYERLRVESVLDGAVATIAGQLEEKGIVIERSYGVETPDIGADRAKLQQVFLHLLNNALNAMPEGGTIKLSTGHIEGQAVKIEVRDNGVGIDPEHIDRIFDPFFTTKSDWDGKGLGLTVAYRIMEEHRGTIRVTSTPGVGTTIAMTLPVSAIPHLE